MFNSEAFEKMTDVELLAALEDLDESEQPPILEIQRARAYASEKYAEAASLAFRISELATSLKNDDLKASALADEGDALIANDEYAEAAIKYELAASLFKQLGVQSRAAKLLYKKANALLNLDDEELTIAAATEATEFASVEGEFGLVGRSLLIRAKSRYWLSKEEEAIEDCLNAAENLAIAGLSDSVADAYEFLGRCLWSLGRHEESMSYLQKSLIIYQTMLKQDSNSKIPEIQQKIALNLHALGRYEDAISLLEKAIEGFRSLGNIDWIATCELNIGDALQELDRDDEAIERLLKAETLAESVGDRKVAGRALHYRAISLHAEGRFADALDLNRRLMASAKNEEEDAIKQMSYVGFVRMLGNLIALERNEEVISSYLSPITWPDFIPSDEERLSAKSSYCYALFRLDRKEEALKVANEGISEANSKHWRTVLATLFEIRGLLTRATHERQSEQDLANAIALYLAAGRPDEANSLAEYFLPKFPENRDTKSI
jgi:tetratricopeptide (TPR) repeat protein